VCCCPAPSRAAELVAERLRVAIRAETATLAEPVTVSIGVAAVEPGHPPMQLEAILTLADQALYEAKLGGRNTVRVRLPAHLDEAPHSDPADSRSGD
jgi:diguanylate cyclase (GGDEF)-like protein